MKHKQPHYKLLGAVVLSSLLVACGGVDVAPERPSPAYPSSVISGHAIDAAIRAGKINIYAFDNNGTKGQRLGSGVSDDQGFYAIEISAKSQTVLVEVSGGSYIEDATGTEVTLAEGERLSAITHYESGQALTIMVTPLTHIAAGLTRYLMAQGSPINTALQQTSADLNTLFNFDVLSTTPADITDSANASSEITDDLLYGFYLAAVSSWTQWAASQNNVEPHTTYTSIGLSQILYADIQADGRLDGNGLNPNNNEAMPLAIGLVPLNQATYRKLFAEHLLAMAHSRRNMTGISLSSLLPTAQGLANNTATSLFGEGIATPIGEEPPSVDTADAKGRYYNGTFTYGVNITSAFGAEEVVFDIDGTTIGPASDPNNPNIEIDTQGYDDGKYQIGVRITDILENESYTQFSVNFDNTLPFANRTSASITNQSSYTLSGEYEDNGAGIESISAQGMAATINADDGTWSANIDLNTGPNTIAVVLTDKAGNQKSMDFDVGLDLTPPSIDTNGTHSIARFSDGSGVFTEEAPLSNQNTNALYLNSSTLDLAGTPIAADDLNNAGVPYFGFNVADEVLDGVGTATDQIAVRMQYEKLGIVLSPWRDISPVDVGQYLIPLTTETLATGWDQTIVNEEHLIHIEIEDAAGNQTQTTFSFTADIYVMPPTVSDAINIGPNQFPNTTFADRANLNNVSFSSLEYSFSNTTGKSFYISLGDNMDSHTVTNEAEQMVRKNRARLKTTTVWQVGLIDVRQTSIGPDFSCPTATAWQNTDVIWNFTPNLTWEEKTVPDPTSGEFEEKFKDSPELELPETSPDWSDVPDFDNQYRERETTDTEFSLRYQYDYVLNPESTTSLNTPAFVTGWQLSETASGASEACGETRFFQQQFVYSYESELGYPKNTTSELIEEASFSTQGFEVTNNDSSESITAISGWYRIPAGSNITVTKIITTPTITNYTETSVASPDTFTSYTPLSYDKTISWEINREINISLAHDAGEDNLNNTSTQDINAGIGAGTNTVTYQILR